MLPTYEAVKRLCEKRNLSFSDVEEGLGIGKNSLYSLKRSQPSTERLNQLADFFGVSVDYLLGRTDEENPVQVVREILKDVKPEELEFDEFFSMDIKKDGQKITDRDKRILKSMIDAYFKESTI